MSRFVNKLQIDLLKRHAGPFLFCFFTLMFLLLMQFLILHVDQLIGKDIPLLVIMDLVATNLAYMVVLAAPMAVLVATLMAFGRFSELNEMTALRASGINPLKIIRPVLIAAFLLFAGLVWFSNYVLPEANHKARSLFIDIRLKKPGFDLKPNIFYDGIDGYTFLVKKIDGETDSLYDVTLFQEPGNDKNRAYIRAEKGFLTSKGDQALSLELINGNMLEYSQSRRGVSDIVQRVQFSRHSMVLDLSDLTFLRSDPSKRNRSDRTMSSQAMLVVVDSLENEINTIYRKSYLNKEKVPSSDMRQMETFISLNPEKLADSTMKTPMDSRYTMINNFRYPEQQQSLIQESIRKTKNYRTAIESARTNIEWRQKRINRFLVEVHKKISIPFACMVFVLFGAPVGIMVKRGNFGFAALVSTVVLTFYWVALIQGEKMADRLFISPFTGMWTFNIVLTLIGLYLIVHITTEFRITRLFRRNKDD